LRHLVYASDEDVKDLVFDRLFWYGWTDVLPEGPKMLIPQTVCTPGGESPTVRRTICELGKGRIPARAE